ncbi:hypothetical protein TNCV_1012331 [Trichonephila clavipes]|uniref:Uncharacterized protein n=1 Tax=Trichonephila clavipes TaxID=2585209 RepID=A0A8X7B9E2_TRICX|nr:hypothetical protein TNCV_1012331 [Trichonephila clavipes]
MGQYDDDECMLPMDVHLDATGHGCDHLDAVNSAWIQLEVSCLSIRTPGFIVDLTAENAHICDAASRVAATIVSKLRVPVTANVVELFVQTLVVLQMNPNYRLNARDGATLSIKAMRVTFLFFSAASDRGPLRSIRTFRLPL